MVGSTSAFVFQGVSYPEDGSEGIDMIQDRKCSNVYNERKMKWVQNREEEIWNVNVRSGDRI